MAAWFLELRREHGKCQLRPLSGIPSFPEIRFADKVLRTDADVRAGLQPVLTSIFI
jgi:hypothetical protein